MWLVGMLVNSDYGVQMIDRWMFSENKPGLNMFYSFISYFRWLLGKYDKRQLKHVGETRIKMQQMVFETTLRITLHDYIILDIVCFMHRNMVFRH